MKEMPDLSRFYSELLNKLTCNTSCKEESSGNINCISCKKILITGSAGSIGSALAKRIANMKPRSIGLLDINESDLNNLMLEISDCSDSFVHIFLCDVSRQHSLKKIFNSYRPDIVFHVAAYKHIPIMEIFPEEAIRVNIIGTYNTAVLSGEFNVEKFIFISTDKAVNPVSTMGKSKKMAESIINKIHREFQTDFIIVRLANVIGSRGSVSEIFVRQILKGGPITLTHPDMNRYFITLAQAVEIILKASEYGTDGGLIIPKLNMPVKISELLKELINEINYEQKSQIKVLVTGCRDGEKFSEELMTSEESKNAVSNNGFFIVNTKHSDKGYDNYLEEFSIYNNTEYFKMKKKFFESELLNQPVLDKKAI